jgi:DNA-binding Xre family transcriptional regulator
MEITKGTVPSLGQVVGGNVHDLRIESELTQVELTARCQQLGLSWHRPKMSAFEAGGARNITLSNLLVLAIALRAHPNDLLAGEGDVEVNPHFRCSLSDIRMFLSGKPVGNFFLPEQQGSVRSTVAVVDVDPPLEVEMAKKFGVTVQDIRDSATNAFEGRTLTQERDIQIARLGPLTKDQRTTHRGHVMRRLSSKIEADLRRRLKVF